MMRTGQAVGRLGRAGHPQDDGIGKLLEPGESATPVNPLNVGVWTATWVAAIRFETDKQEYD